MVYSKKRAFLFVSFSVISIYFSKDINQTNVDVESVTIKKHPRYSITEIFRDYFPQCYIPGNHSLIDWLQTYGMYVSTARPPRYDHWCPVMKARYNCAWPPNITGTPQAFEYKFVWKHPHYAQVCDLDHLLEFIGGPAGLSQRHVVLQGNSYLRQVWEALVCGFQDQITNLTLYQNGPPTSLAYITSRRGKLITPRELGQFIVAKRVIEGCHGPSLRTPLGNYYRPNVTIPSNRDKCTDDMAMVEFGNVQFSFIFHPSRFHTDAIVEAYRKLGIPKVIDTVVWMGDDETQLRNLTARSRIALGPLLPLLIKTQNWSLGRYFGADNPWITDPPDNHPCMPGIPDDETNVLLLLLMMEKYQTQTDETGERQRKDKYQ